MLATLVLRTQSLGVKDGQGGAMKRSLERRTDDFLSGEEEVKQKNKSPRFEEKTRLGSIKIGRPGGCMKRAIKRTQFGSGLQQS